jgi:dephospho-CoA kinase
MKIIGITGGVGAGKSTILDELALGYDAMIVKADLVGHHLMEPGQPCYQPVIALLGQSIVREDGVLDRGRIAALIYQDENLRLAMNCIVHPAVKSYILECIHQEAGKGRVYFFVEAALLLEDRYNEICDEIWYIYAHPEIRRKRLKEERNYGDDKIDQIMASQMSDEVFSEQCDVKIDNSGTMEETRRQIACRMSKRGSQYGQ